MIIAYKKLISGPIYDIFELAIAELSEETHYIPKFYV